MGSFGIEWLNQDPYAPLKQVVYKLVGVLYPKIVGPRASAEM